MRLSCCLAIVGSLFLGFIGVGASAGDPLVTVHYPAASKSGPSPVRGNATFPLRAPDTGVVYFTIDTRYLGENAGELVDVHNTLHFVIGGFGPDRTKGEARVNGPGVTPRKGRRALLNVTNGWVWVSDQPPSGWSAHTAVGHEPPVTAGVLSEARPVVRHVNADTAVGWSIITLLGGEWTWAGAIGTEFIYRIAPDMGDGNRLELVYGLDSASKSLLTLTNANQEEVQAEGGSYVGIKGRSAIEARLTGRWLDNGSHKAFVKSVRDAVARIGRE